MRIVLDPGPGRPEAAGEAQANLKVATLVAAALRLATGDGVDIAITARDETAVPYEARLAILAGADLAIRIEHGAFEVVVGLRRDSSSDARALAQRMVAALRRELGPMCRLRHDSYRRIHRDLPNIVVASLPPSADLRAAASALASTVAAHLTSAALALA